MKTNRNPWLGFLLSERYSNFALLVLRLFVGGMMLTHGVAKLENFAGLREGFPDPIGLGSAVSLVMIILVEVGASLMIATGLLTRFAVIPAIFSMFVAAFLAPPHFTFAGSELAIMYLGMYIVIFIAGPGKCSIDYLIGKTFAKASDEE